MSEDNVQAGEFSGVVVPKKARKPRSPSKFVLVGVSDGEGVVGSWTPLSRGKSRKECEGKALAQPNGRYVVMCQHGEVFEFVEKTAKELVRVKA